MKEEITDYETVERTRERTICDECGKVLDPDDGDYAVPVPVNARVEKSRRIDIEPAARHEVEELERKVAQKESADDVYGSRLRGTTIKKKTTITTKPEYATATLDWCPSCVEDKTGKTVPKRDVVTDTEFDEEPALLRMLTLKVTHGLMFVLGFALAAILILDGVPS